MNKITDTPEIRKSIRNIVAQHPGLRKREIAYYLGVYHIRIISLLHRMVDDNELVETTYNDPANMEFYSQYWIKEGF